MAEEEKPKIVLDVAAEQRFSIIIRRLQEVLGGDTIRTILAEGRTPKCYFGKSMCRSIKSYTYRRTSQGTATTGRRRCTLRK